VVPVGPVGDVVQELALFVRLLVQQDHDDAKCLSDKRHQECRSLSKTLGYILNYAASEVVCYDEKSEPLFDTEDYQFLTKFGIDQTANNKFMLQFFGDQGTKSKEVSSEKVKTEESKSTDQKEEETYIIVRKQKDFNGEPKGYKLGIFRLIQKQGRPLS